MNHHDARNPRPNSGTCGCELGWGAKATPQPSDDQILLM